MQPRDAGVEEDLSAPTTSNIRMAYKPSQHSQVSMNDADRELFATWQNIAALASTETDEEKLVQIIELLRAALAQHENLRGIRKQMRLRSR